METNETKSPSMYLAIKFHLNPVEYHCIECHISEDLKERPIGVAPRVVEKAQERRRNEGNRDGCTYAVCKTEDECISKLKSWAR